MVIDDWETVGGPEPVAGPRPPRASRRTRLLIAAAVLALVLVVAGIHVRRELSGTPLVYAGRVRVDGIGEYQAPLGGQPVWVVNQPVGRVVTFAMTLRNSSGETVHLQHVDPMVATVTGVPGAQVRLVGADGSRAAARPAVGSAIPADTAFDLVLHTVGQGCLTPTYSTTVRSVTVRLRRFGLERNATVPFPHPVLVIGPRPGAGAAPGPCGVPSF